MDLFSYVRSGARLDTLSFRLAKGALIAKQIACTPFRARSPSIRVLSKRRVPFSSIPMLKNPPPFEIMLAHRAVELAHGLRDQAIGRFHLSEGQMEGLFIAVKILVIKVGILIKPKRESQGSPTTSLVHEDLA